MAGAREVEVRIASADDLVPARAEGRTLAGELGFSRTDSTLIATAISEIARNILVHAGSGRLTLRRMEDNGRCGMEVVASDSGPGIRDVEAALEDGRGTGEGLGLGLPGARRIMDDFEIRTAPGRGTTVSMTKWRERDELEWLRSQRHGGA